MSEPILPFVTTDDVGKDEATVVKVDGREIKKNPIDIGEDGLRILQIIAGIISASTQTLGSSIKHIFLQNGKLTVSTANIGTNKKPVYMSNGEVKASDANAGSNVKHMYMEGGEIKESDANVGEDGLHLLKMANGEIQASDKTKGSSTKPIYLNNGAIAESNANVGEDGFHLIKMVNGELQVSTGSKGSNLKFVYVENGEVKETSVTLGSSIKHVYLQDGVLKASDSTVGGKKDVWTPTSDDFPEIGKRYAYLIDGVYEEIEDPDPTVAFSGDVYEFVESRFTLAHLKNGETVTDPTANIGGDACFIYLKDGELRASTLSITEAGRLIKIVNGSIQKDTSSNIGGEGKLVKIVNGKIIEDTSATVGDGMTLVFLSNGQLTESEQSVGDDTHPVKLDNGKLVQVAGELATKVAPALERKNDPRELNEAERQVPTTPTPSSEDPGTMVANKEYVDSFMSSNATYGYGVVDGTICTDAGDNPCVTSFDVGTTLKEITYTTLNDCYLYIQVEGLADIYSDDSSPALDIRINGQSLGRLLDHMDDTSANNLYDRPACGIPVAKGSIVRIANVDESAPMFSTWGTGASLVISEYRLSSISPTIEMPKYDREAASDIHLAAFSEEGYVAPRRGYLLASIFDETGKYVPTNKSMKIYINDILVMNGRNIVKQMMTDAAIDDPTLFNNTAGVTTKNMTVQAGDTLTLGNPDHFKVYNVSTDPVTHKPKYTQVLNPGTVTDSVLTFDSSLVGNNVVVIDGVKTIEKVKLTDTGACLIPVNYKDVIKIRTATDTGADQHGDASTWPSTSVYSLTADETGEIGKVYYKATDDGMVDVSDEVVGQNISGIGYPVYECEDISDDDEFHEWQALFLRTRQTGADTEPGALERDDFVLGGFMDGTVFQDDRGNDLITEVPYTEWALAQDADNLYTYKYIVKNDCMLYMSFLVHANTTDADKVKITLNGREFDYYYENEASLGGFADSDKQLMLPISAGTVVGFHSKARPDHNIIGTADSGTGTYAIKIKEYMLVAGGNVSDISQLQVGGGVIDGTLCTDTQGNPCIAEIDLTAEGNNRPSYVYRTTKDCLLVVEVAKALVRTEYNHIDVKVNGKVVGVLTDNDSADDDNDNIRIPVRAGSDVELVGDGTNNIFGSTPAGSFIRFTEYKLTSITRQIGLPNYDRGVDITSYVKRTTLAESRGYKAETDGYVLFQANTLSQSCVLHGFVANVQVYRSGFRQAESDFFNNNGIVPVREGDEIDFSITNSDGSSLVPMTDSDAPKVLFFPLAGTVNFDRYPNGVAPNSKTVRQEDMNLIATTSGATRTYSNEITITESGWCQINANYDGDYGGILDDSLHYVVAVEALISGAWSTIARMTNNDSVSDGCGNWYFSFPVEANLKLRMAANFKYDGSSTNTFGTSGDLPFSRRCQALCWVIPTSKFFNPEQNLAGSAGVIDGSIWKKVDGTDEVTTIHGGEVTILADNGTLNTSTKVLTYNVKNDCYLYIQCNNPGGAMDVGAGTAGVIQTFNSQVYVNGIEVGRLLDNNTGSYPNMDCPSFGVAVSRGSVVTIKNIVGENSYQIFSVIGATASVSFTEFKLRATNVVAAMPDWDDSKKVAVIDGYIAESDGFLRINVQYGQVSGHYSVLVNDIVVWKHYDGDEDRAHGDAGVIPICRGDKVTISKSSASTQTADITFYPVKMREIKNEVVEEVIDVLSKVNEVVLVDKPADDAIFNSAAALMSNTAMVPTTSEDGVDHPAGQFPAPSWTGYDTVCKFIRGVTEEELRTLTGNSLLSLKNADLEIKLVTYSSGTGEEYEEVEPLGLVASSNTQPRAYIVPVRPIVRTINGVRSVRVPWPSKFSTASLSHWSTDTSATFFPSQYGDVVTLGSSIKAKVVLTIKQRSSSAA